MEQHHHDRVSHLEEHSESLRAQRSRNRRNRRRLAVLAGGLATVALATSGAPAVAGHLEVHTNDIVNGAVTTPKIANGAVTNAKLHNGSVGTSKLQFQAVGSGKIKNGAIVTHKLGNGAVTTGKLASTAVVNTAKQLTDIRYVSFSDSVVGGSYNHTTVSCPDGYHVVGGGGFTSTTSWVTVDSYPSGTTGWSVEFKPNTVGDTGNQTGTAYAICIKAQAAFSGKFAPLKPRS